MHRRKVLQYLAALPVTAAMPASAAPGSLKEPSRKKGWADGNSNAIKTFGASWYYTGWLTEFNGWSGSERENLEFPKSALKTPELAKSVERYGYFEPGKGKEYSLFKPDGELFRMGELHRDAGT